MLLCLCPRIVNSDIWTRDSDFTTDFDAANVIANEWGIVGRRRFFATLESKYVFVLPVSMRARCSLPFKSTGTIVLVRGCVVCLPTWLSTAAESRGWGFESRSRFLQTHLKCPGLKQKSHLTCRVGRFTISKYHCYIAILGLSVAPRGNKQICKVSTFNSTGKGCHRPHLYLHVIIKGKAVVFAINAIP